MQVQQQRARYETGNLLFLSFVPLHLPPVVTYTHVPEHDAPIPGCCSKEVALSACWLGWRRLCSLHAITQLHVVQINNRNGCICVSAVAGKGCASMQPVADGNLANA